jgi:hypothetical protein
MVIVMEYETISSYYLFRTEPSIGDKTFVNSLTDEEEDKKNQETEQIVCRQCKHIITKPEERIQVNGSHQHTFANPSGLLFEIGCFQTANGCGYMDQTTKEYTWFSGYSWRIAVCGKCLTQLGWLFSSSIGSSSFYGLILNKLVWI